MSKTPPSKPSLRPPGTIKRQTVSVSQQQLIKTSYLQPDQLLPLVIEPAGDALHLVDWAKNNCAFIETELLKHGGILFRNFTVNVADELEAFVQAVSTQLLEYNDRATPRSQVSGHIYTSTDYAADQSIEMHNESSYAFSWASKIFFGCVIAAQEGGETPIADSRKVLQRISPATRERFIENQVMYVRNFGDGLGQSWQSVFNTDDKAVLEEYCRANRIQVEWKDEQRLRTRQVRPAVIRHPRTGDLLWFNQATAFHVSTLAPDVRDVLLAEFAQDELPKNALYGDGSPIEDAALEEVRAAFRAEMVMFPWQPGDILLLDNMLVAHGRAPFVGPRKILVGMSEPCTWDDVVAA